MKTWKQLEAMAKRHGMTLDWRTRFCAIDHDTDEVVIVNVEKKLPEAHTQRILRAMTEAALRELAK